MDAMLKKGGPWQIDEENVTRLFELVQLDIWASLASALSLPIASLAEMGRSELAAYVKKEQDIYADFAQRGARVLIHQDMEFQLGGSEAVAAACAEIERNITKVMDQLIASSQNTIEEVALLRECKQLSGSVLELYNAAFEIKGAFDNVNLFSELPL